MLNWKRGAVSHREFLEGGNRTLAGAQKSCIATPDPSHEGVAACGGLSNGFSAAPYITAGARRRRRAQPEGSGTSSHFPACIGRGRA
jgi:hypothetical protein